jgi:hypothetical protein
MKNGIASLLVMLALASGGIAAGKALGAAAPTTLSFLVQNAGTEYVTASGTTAVFPGHLSTGDRIFSRDVLLRGSVRVGYDNEVCTVTFDSNDLCQTVLVLSDKGDLAVTWLWVGRNASATGPAQFSGVIEGGTGVYAHASGVFEARVLPTGLLQVHATLA